MIILNYDSKAQYLCRIAALSQMRTFLNVPLLGINCTCQMSAHYSSVLAYTLMTMCPYSKQVQDIELYGASVGDDLDAKMN